VCAARGGAGLCVVCVRPRGRAGVGHGARDLAGHAEPTSWGPGMLLTNFRAAARRWLCHDSRDSTGLRILMSCSPDPQLSRSGSSAALPKDGTRFRTTACTKCNSG